MDAPTAASPDASPAPWWRSFEGKLLCAALLVRLLYLSTILDNPFFQHPVGDEKHYHLWALTLVEGGQFIPDYPYYEMPLHAYFLAGLYRLFGPNMLAVRLVQVLIGTVNVLLLYRLARRLFDPTVAKVAGILAATYLPFLYYEGLLLKESVAVFLMDWTLLLALGALARATPLASWCTGVVLGLTCLTRANVLALIPALLLAPAIARRPDRPPVRPAAALGFLLGLAMVIAPVTIRNKLESGEWVLLTVYGGQNLYTANNYDNTTGDYAPVPFVNPVTMNERVDFHRRAEEMVGHRLSPTEVADLWRDRSLLFSITHPKEQLRMIGRRFVQFWNAAEIPDNHSYDMFKGFSFVLRLPLPGYWLIAPFALLGLGLLRARWRTLYLLYVSLGLYLVSLLPYWISSRYRLPIVGVMLLLAAGAMVELARRARTGSARTWPFLMALLATTAFCWWPMTVARSDELDQNLARAYVLAGRYEEGLALYRQVRERHPNPYTDLLFADALGRSGQPDAAAEIFHTLADPSQPQPVRQRAYGFWGDLYRRDQRWPEAEAVYRSALALDRTDYGLWNNLAMTLMAQERFAEAEEALGEAVRIVPTDPTIRRNLEALRQRSQGP